MDFNQNKTEFELTSGLIDSKIAEINTLCQARIDSPNENDEVYDENTQLATVLPLEKIIILPEMVGASIYKLRDPESSPFIRNVPVLFPSMKVGELEASLTFPITRGTKGVIAYCKFSNEEYLENGDEFLPDVSEYFGMNGAYFIPGGNPKNGSLSDINNQKLQLKAKNSGIDSRFEIDTKSGEISISVKGGKVTIDNEGNVVIDSGNIKLGSDSSSLALLHETFAGLIEPQIALCNVKIGSFPVPVDTSLAFLGNWADSGKSKKAFTE